MPRTQYVLIARPEYHPTAVSRDVLADMHARGEVITSERPITKAEIKRNRIHVYEDSWYFKYQAWADWKARVDGKTFKARVLWFRDDGTGMIEIPELNERLPIYACNIAGKKTWYPETACVFYERDQEIDVSLAVHPGQTFVIGVTPGHVDQVKWESLDHSKLAFRCNEAGEAVTGLFA
jgi:hypothetical protein